VSLRGEIQIMPLADVFQWLALLQKTGVLRLESGEIEQHFYFSSGALAAAASTAYHATDSEENVRRLLAAGLRWQEGRFEFIEAPLPEEVTAINLRLHTQQLVLDTFREFDEAAEAARAVGAAGGASQSLPPPIFTLADGLRLAVVDRLLRGEVKVPLLPTVVNKVLEITKRENFSIRDLSNVILTDQVIAGKVLQQANSALYGSARRVDSLPAAIQRLGSQTVTNIVLALSLQSARPGRDIFLAHKQRLWQRSIICALLAHLIAATIRLDRDLAFLCGLMMDFGKTVLFSVIQDAMSEESDYQMAPTEVIEEIIEAYHPKVGGVVCEKWHLPAPVLEAIQCHHALTAARDHHTYAAVANLSDILAASLATTSALDAQPLTPESLARRPAAGLLGLSLTQAQAILERAPESLRLAQEFSVK
jgi:HD-like signal output (HDOD) protein